MTWKKADFVFAGGIQAAAGLRGRKVRLTRELSGIRAYIPWNPTGQGEELKLPVGTLGFIGGVPAEARDEIVIPIPQRPPPPDTIEKLQRVPFHSFKVNWPTFRVGFEIDP